MYACGGRPLRLGRAKGAGSSTATSRERSGTKWPRTSPTRGPAPAWPPAVELPPTRQRPSTESFGLHEIDPRCDQQRIVHEAPERHRLVVVHIAAREVQAE